MLRLTTEQVMSLAPDAAGAAAGRELSAESKWVSLGTAGDAVWGEAKGSGKLPYQTAVDLSGIAYKCSCPSRKIPCKHALGLLLRYSQNQIASADVPAWVAEWLGKRSEKAVKKAESPATPNPEAAAGRSEKRWRNILDGLDECEAFMTDAVSQGLLAANSVRSWDQMAARMIDAQAPGVAMRIKRIGSQIGVGPDWVDRTVAQLGSLSLLIQAARSIENLEAPLQADVRTAVGISTRKEDIDAEPVIDIWDVFGQTSEVDDRLTAYRTWLRGRGSRRWALHLTFVARGQTPEAIPIPGTAYAGSIRYYESAWPLRAQLEEAEQIPFVLTAGENFQTALEEAAEVWSKSPWTEVFPVHLSQATLGLDADEMVAIDSSGEALKLQGTSFMQLLAGSGNHPSELFGEWNGERLRLVAAWGAWGYLAL